ncbi:SDR family NAD(P)-dependent oxidoreductase [Xanthomonas oryzae]|uniref:SDR family NAD(P)-dependent oxidoreductase n=1 Tax=Xanthomonas oryzae TaxID=347 RepID=UPI000427BA5B|nr:SDR family NAD(P)-dependent oxidoreductase [Xanthomonas oryzae]ALS95037.1 3-hydroxy-2-methylbutyryl-CoA dehydrogenase [Xanthomonas oryzae pv. oryzae]AUI90427.1 3-hydroxyacyl-CoA dehydrogenase [Xanthomonas oryzae pv. oryzae]AUI94102.1 3-hydroxyacyl-CoA dehydrogenase [Xanthomonas oryzae pv. oryzae]AUI97772.1 3-hydroxyacyl-CoA dehydrogenase [Xanthomonas oryzae pv. oryzae]AUJ01448.1 3-hydroxyacyl-CoA dehydrogenase [Xanthomonas oryzae pv. oryzae]
MQPSSVLAIVTGGVSGLGLAVAQRLVADGGKVALFDVNADKADAALALLDAGNAHYLATDVTDEAQVAAQVAKAAQALGGLNLVVNCAGILGAGRVLGKEAPMPLATFRSTVLVNLVGSFNVAKAAADVMQHNPAGDDGERGVIVNTASVAAFEGQIGQAAYAASKGGVVGMTLPMARELARFGIRVMTIAPGVFWTPMVDGMPEAVQQSLAASIPFPSRLGQPDEYADTVAFILRNRYLNGDVIRLDGGVRLAPK